MLAEACLTVVGQGYGLHFCVNVICRVLYFLIYSDYSVISIRENSFLGQSWNQERLFPLSNIDCIFFPFFISNAGEKTVQH